MTYYVDATGGDDSNDGLGPSTAWQTIAKVNASAFVYGDFVLFKSGEVWREMLVPPSSGCGCGQVTLDAYGPGAEPKITAADVASSWTPGAIPDTWYAGPISADPTFVSFDGGPGVEKASVDDLATATDWYYDPGTDRLYVTGATDPATIWGAVEYGVRPQCIRIDGKSYLTFANLHLEHGTKFGGCLRLLGATDFCELAGLTIKNCANDGILFNQTDGAGHTVRDCDISDVRNGVVHFKVSGDSADRPYLFQGNRISRCRTAGISIGADYGVCERNRVTDCGNPGNHVSGIHIHDADNKDQGSYWTVQDNTILRQRGAGNDGGGIISDTGTHDNEIARNTVVNCESYGVALYECGPNVDAHDNVLIRNNQRVGPNVGEIFVGGLTGPCSARDNTVWVNDGLGVMVQADSLGAITLDGQNYYRDGPGDWWGWGGVRGRTIADWRSVSGQGMNSRAWTYQAVEI